MEENVKNTLKIINEDGDSFAKRAEMYYRKRPEIVDFIEESFRSYRALAERYDHLSTELQSANHMIATAFPEHVQFPLGDDDDDDDDDESKPLKNLQLIPLETNIPEVPEIPKKEFLMVKSRKRLDDAKKSSSSSTLVSSGLSKEEAFKEIDKIHKGILVLQTEKEFVRSSYEQKYWNLENEITEMQKRVCSLQDEFGFGEEIEDDEARTLVASTALSSCKETIAKLEETQKRFAQDMETEKKRIDTVTEKFETLRNKFEIKEQEEEDEVNLSNVEVKIDELVEKVVSLETTASSHSTIVKTLRSDTEGLYEHIKGLEEDKACLLSDSIDMKKRVTTLEDELSKVKNLFQNVEDENKNLQKNLTEANNTAEDLSEKIQDGTMDEEDEVKFEDAQEHHSEDFDLITKEEEKSERESTCFGSEFEDEERRKWMRLLPADGTEEREKVLLDEYTSVLRDYREMKRKLSEVEKKNRDCFFELALQLRELKNDAPCEDVEYCLVRKKPMNPVERNQSESVSISRSSNSSISKAQDQQEGDLMIKSERTNEDDDEVKEEFDIDDSLKKTTVEEKVCGDIDAVLEENTEFWLRFSTSVHQIQKYQTSVQDLTEKLSKLRFDSMQKNSNSSSFASEAKPIYTQLKEIQTELQLWLENSAVFREELEGRYEKLCNIKDEVSKVTKVNNSEISSYQAAKFQGEILNMKMENKRVFNELQEGLDRAKALRIEVERTVSKLEKDLGILNATTTGIRSLRKMNITKPRIPLRSFLFGVKLKKNKQ